MRRTTRLVAASTAALLFLGACGGSDDDDSPGDGTQTQQEGGDIGDAQDPTREGPVEIEGAEEGGIVKVISNTPLETMDPSEAYYVHTVAILSGLVTRSLTQWTLNEDGTVTLVPDLATDLGTSNEDYTEWSFTLREGIKYEDGTPVTAEDVKFGLERTMDTTTFPESPGAYSLDYYEGGEDYKGPYTGNGAELDAITVDGNTITVKMAQPFPDMPYWMSFPASGPIPADPAISDPAKYRTHPLATGPYKFADYTPKKSLTLVRNDEWDPATDPGRTAYPDGYEMDFTVASEQIDEILLNDQGDAKNTMTFDDILGSNYRKFLDEAGDRVKQGTTPCTRYWAPDYRKITDIRVRQALALAYPYSAAIKAGGLIEGVNRIPGTNLMAPGTPGREEYEPLGVPAGTTDPERSKELLAEAGAEGFEIKFLYATDDPLSVAANEAIAKGLEEGGFKATLVPTTLEALTTVREDPNADINVRSAGWCSDWPSGGSWFPPLLRTENLEQLGQISQNYSVFSEEDVDTRIDEILSMPIEEQPAAWNELDKYIAETYFPLFVTTYDGVVWAAGSNVQGNESDVVLGMPSYKDIHLTNQ
ncbi:MAG: ABC transporter substrate-binding protein [Actinomycetota bacterium]|nr:ABC transporter substrate-binding protein [Actinomycetota bacterium]